MPTKDEDLSLENWLEGEVLGRVDAALEEIIKNCLDPNYDKSPRKVELTITLTPNDRRDEAYPDFHVKKTMGKIKFKGAAIRIGLNDRGRGAAREFVDPQKQLFNGQVTPMPNRKEGVN
jgi:hypothetical protein